MDLRKKYSLLPDYMPPEKVKEQFEELLKLMDTEPKIKPIQIAGALFELTDRQWHTYTI